MGCDARRRHNRPRHRYFNPRTPVGCDRHALGHDNGAVGISIHAPQWGATVPHGAVLKAAHISIHAPQWGATRSDVPSCAARSNFNPRTPVGCDWPATFVTAKGRIFQSTHPSGVRRRFRPSAPRNLYFNPRTPVGCDFSSELREAFNIDISIHAPQWGATCGHLRRGVGGVQISIHAPQWGATALLIVVLPAWRYFNPRTPVGCDRPRPLLWRSGPYFNPRTPVGCDRENGHSIP